MCVASPKIICITIYNKNEYYDRMKTANEKYLNWLYTNTKIMNNLRVFYIVYTKLENVDYIIEGNTLFINGEETYMPGILDKTLCAMDIITTKLNIEYDFILRANASVVINYIELFSYLKTAQFDFLNNNYYIGPYNTLGWIDPKNGIIDTTYYGTRFCGGAFILLNKQLVLNIIHNSTKLLRNLIDDVSIGQYINTLDNVHQIDIKDCVLFNHNNYNKYESYIALINNTNKDNRMIDVCNFMFQVDDIITKNKTSLFYSIVILINPNTTISQLTICFKLMEKHIITIDLDYIYIITTRPLINQLLEHISTYNEVFQNKIQFINEDDVYVKNTTDNWLYQQILKLEIAKRIKTKYYLVLDIDMYLIKNLNYHDMFFDGKIIYPHERFPHNNPPGYTNRQWWNDSAKLLDYPVELLYNKTNLMGVTPQLLVTDIVNDLLVYLNQQYGDNYKEIMLRNRFTEYALYWIFIIKNNMENLYTISGRPLLDVNEEFNILHYPSSVEHLRTVVEKALKHKPFHFLIIQGWLKINLELYSDIIWNYLRNNN